MIFLQLPLKVSHHKNANFHEPKFKALASFHDNLRSACHTQPHAKVPQIDGLGDDLGFQENFIIPKNDTNQ